MSPRRNSTIALTLLAASVALGAEAKPKTDLVQDTPENGLKSYLSAWQNADYVGILACIKVTDDTKKDIVERYVNFLMWNDALERACVDKFGEDEALKVLGHVRTFAKQFDLDLKKRLLNASVEFDQNNRSLARVFLRVEKDRPDGLKLDELSFRDDYQLIKDAGKWKIDFLKTCKLDDPEHEEDVKYYAFKAYPILSTRLKELTAEVKSGKLKTADDVKTEIENVWQKVPGATEAP